MRVEGDPLVVDLDARVLVDVARRVVLEETRAAIVGGRRPDGGPQRPLSAARAEQDGRVSRFRGFATGHLADELRATPIKGDHNSASSTIHPPTDRNVFIATEARRGVRYLGLGGEMKAAIAEGVKARLAEMLAGGFLEAVQGEPRARDKAPA